MLFYPLHNRYTPLAIRYSRYTTGSHPSYTVSRPLPHRYRTITKPFRNVPNLFTSRYTIVTETFHVRREPFHIRYEPYYIRFHRFTTVTQHTTVSHPFLIVSNRFLTVSNRFHPFPSVTHPLPNRAASVNGLTFVSRPLRDWYESVSKPFRTVAHSSPAVSHPLLTVSRLLHHRFGTDPELLHVQYKMVANPSHILHVTTVTHQSRSTYETVSHPLHWTRRHVTVPSPFRTVTSVTVSESLRPLFIVSFWLSCLHFVVVLLKSRNLTAENLFVSGGTRVLYSLHNREKPLQYRHRTLRIRERTVTVPMRTFLCLKTC